VPKVMVTRLQIIDKDKISEAVIIYLFLLATERGLLSFLKLW